MSQQPTETPVWEVYDEPIVVESELGAVLGLDNKNTIPRMNLDEIISDMGDDAILKVEDDEQVEGCALRMPTAHTKPTIVNIDSVLPKPSTRSKRGSDTESDEEDKPPKKPFILSYPKEVQTYIDKTYNGVLFDPRLLPSAGGIIILDDSFDPSTRDWSAALSALRQMREWAQNRLEVAPCTLECCTLLDYWKGLTYDRVQKKRTKYQYVFILATERDVLPNLVKPYFKDDGVYFARCKFMFVPAVMFPTSNAADWHDAARIQSRGAYAWTYTKLSNLVEHYCTDAATVEAKQTLTDQWYALLDDYYNLIRQTTGCGRRVQAELDASLRKVQSFATLHRQFEKDVPKRYVSQDDGTQGLLSGIGMSLYK